MGSAILGGPPSPKNCFGDKDKIYNITFRTSANNFFNVMLIGLFEQGLTEFNVQYLKTRVSAGSAYLLGSKQ